VRKPPLVERVEAEGLVWPQELGALAHVLAGERGRGRVGTTIPAAVPWIAAAVPPGVPVYVRGDVPVDDPDVSGCDSLAAEAPFDLLVTDDAAVAGLLVAGGLALVVGPEPEPEGLLTARIGDGLTLAVHIR
jgi:hypothetical protein